MRTLLFAALLWMIAPLVFGAHPLVTDDPGTQGRGNQQIEANTDWARQRDASAHIGSFTYTYGALDTLDVFLSAPQAFNAPSGLEDMSLGAKWRFHESETLSLAIEPQLFLPTGDETKSLGNGKTSMALTGILAYDTAPWRLLGNLALLVNRYKLQADRDANHSVIWRTSMSIWRILNHEWKLVSDMGIQRSVEKAADSNPGFLLAGFIYSPTPHLDLDAGVKFGLQCGACTAVPKRQGGVGLTVRF